MIRSMTGFGSGSACEGGWRVEATVRTLNHRYLSVRSRSLGDRPWLQARVEELVKRSFDRGEIGVWLGIELDVASPDVQLSDRERLRSLHAELLAVCEELSLPSPPTLESLISVGGLQPARESEEEIWPAVKAALDNAIAEAQATRDLEGSHLAEELARILAKLAEAADTVEAEFPAIERAVRERLLTRAHELSLQLDPERLEAEVALLLERQDVREELIRFRGHVSRAKSLLASVNPVGKELDFISQELLREVNTLGAKARNSGISDLVIDMKLAIEQLREQVQNVE
jgi:uncharacterized protein (TIGR00255 family)